MKPHYPIPRSKLNKKLSKFMTCDCIPHIPISDFMRQYFLSRVQIFTLARKNLLSITQVKKRYFVAIPPDVTIEDIYNFLDDGCMFKPSVSI